MTIVRPVAAYMDYVDALTARTIEQPLLRNADLWLYVIFAPMCSIALSDLLMYAALHIHPYFLLLYFAGGVGFALPPLYVLMYMRDPTYEPTASFIGASKSLLLFVLVGIPVLLWLDAQA
jgi:hypothetical protein